MSEIWSEMCIGLHVKYPLFLLDFIDTWIFKTDFRKILKYQISWKSVLWETSYSRRLDRQADMARLKDALRKFRNMPTNQERDVTKRVEATCSRTWQNNYVSPIFSTCEVIDLSRRTICTLSAQKPSHCSADYKYFKNILRRISRGALWSNSGWNSLRTPTWLVRYNNVHTLQLCVLQLNKT